MDESTDVSDKSQVVLVFRYIKNGKAVEKFGKFFNPADLIAATLSAIVINELELLIGSFSEKLVAQTYDGAAVLRGVNSRVQTRVKEVYGNAHFLHCYAHQLNLVMQRAASHHKQARIFNNLSRIPVFFSQSSHRTKVLEDATKGRQIPRPSSTRWNFKSRTVNQVHELKEKIIECLPNWKPVVSKILEVQLVALSACLEIQIFYFGWSFFKNYATCWYSIQSNSGQRN